MKSFIFGRIVENRAAFLRSAGRILWILIASGSIGPSGLTLERHVSPFRQPSPFAHHFDETDFDDDARALQAKGCFRINSASRVRLPVVSASKATSRSKPSRKFGLYSATLRSTAHSYAFR
jgi:hypothetical protein